MIEHGVDGGVGDPEDTDTNREALLRSSGFVLRFSGSSVRNGLISILHSSPSKESSRTVFLQAYFIDCSFTFNIMT